MNIRVFNRVLDSTTSNSDDMGHHVELPSCIPFSQSVLHKEDSSTATAWRSSDCHHHPPSRGDLTRQLLRDTKIPVPSKFNSHPKILLSKNLNKSLLHADLSSMLSLSSQPLHNDDDFTSLFPIQSLTSNSASTSTNNCRKPLCFDNSCSTDSRARGLTNRKSDPEVHRKSRQSSKYCADSIHFKAKKDFSNCSVFEAADSDHPLAAASELNHQVRRASSCPSSFPVNSSKPFENTACTFHGRKSLRKRSLISSLSSVSLAIKNRLYYLSSSIFDVMYPKHSAEEQLIKPAVASPSSRMKLNKDYRFMENCTLQKFSLSDTPLLPWHEVLARKEVRRPRLNSDFFRVYVLERQMRKAGKLSAHSAGRAQLISHPKPNMMNMFSSPLQIQL
ncbi:SPAPB1A10.08-like, conserved protein [Schizosaccharomyces osmophilus]|uniref:SPAPB1A10.08-like, conserved protein n=1 Tax=Schizosaccharomyces osmophilus TaxID=2545709 RepID=A0AAE9WCL2_9SCHI|nr:SPAPB1A10.08-like, conserved protein [Schizosaccharomyces osmophilus]WBW73348.1 SPAPB1A10.08-like, conserved protein [Schizosaccharomyces osmophilus]